jgi:hypothetical protein
MPLVDLFVVANSKIWALQHPVSDDDIMHPTERTAVIKVAGESFGLVVDMTWHPHRSRLKVWWKTKRYRRILVGAVPELDRQYLESRSSRRRWERELLRKERSERPARREANSREPAKSALAPSSSL